MAAMCQDNIMLDAYKNNKDLYASIASLAFNKSYKDCLEFKTDDDGNYILDENGERITYKEGKSRRDSAKTILLGILYGRGLNSVAEQLNTTKQKAQEIQDKVFKGFPAIKKFEDDTIEMAKTDGFVTTFWGRKRRLPEMQLDEYEFSWIEGHGDLDPLSFDNEIVETEIPQSVKSDYIRKLRNNRFDSEKRSKILEEAKSNGIKIVDNGGKIADATRQCVNSRIQGSAADMSKIAGRNIYDNERLRDLDFKLLIPIHDEYLAECPVENAKECKQLFSDCMCSPAADLGIPIKCDVTITDRWYGNTVSL
jgi:DNA polymerase I-like protein with 3'-5' exonuclease and polymerase domains